MNPRPSRCSGWLAFAWLLTLASLPGAPAPTRSIGVAAVDITPSYSVRLSGYGSRRSESEGIEQRIWAKALAFGTATEGAAVLITVDNCGVPGAVREELAQRLRRISGLKSERLAIASSHTHSAPALKGILPNLFSQDIPPDHQDTIDRYTRELTDKLEQVALAALADRQPSRLAWTKGKVGFAANRRTPGGPVDHDLPLLCVTDPSGRVRAVLVGYACHCTTVALNRICGDWAGYAQAAIQRDHPGAIALVAIGCGADANPSPRNTYELARQHGEAIGHEVNRLLAQPMTPLQGKILCRTQPIDLPFDTLPTRTEWEAKARDASAPIAYHAQRNLAKLDRGETLPTSLPYLVQTWTWGNELAQVFLPGEVVVDYALRLKRAFDSTRLWVNAYANDVPCYIPSRRILREGGYEGGGAMVYYDRPTRFTPAVEDLIVGAVHTLLPKQFIAKSQTDDSPGPRSPQASLAAMHTTPGFTIELVAAEPLIVDPVAIDWGADGKLWVVEMRDYPSGMNGQGKPGGRVTCLTRSKPAGRYDRAAVFLDQIPFPTGIMAWKNGVLICAAPDILYAEDTDGDGKADVVRKIFTGFFTDNFQARVNSLSLGLDGWVHGANGLLGGIIRSATTGNSVDLRGQDFRIDPELGLLETVSGLTQQGRARDDWDNWFGCDNSTLVRHYPLPDHYLHRNPHVRSPSPGVFVPGDPDPNQLFPSSRTQPRFNDPGSVNRTTSACGLGLYRDHLLGEDFYGNALVCEPVHNLVHRLKLEPRNITFTGRRPAAEQTNEFLSSSDLWFRPVQVRTGPDGALWIVDMYRSLIEHPRWIPAEQLASIDPRAGDDKGRIYRVYPRGTPLRPMRDLRRMEAIALAAALDTPNGTERDRVQLEMLRRHCLETVPALEKLALNAASPEVRVQALSVLGCFNSLSLEVRQRALRDAHPGVRQHAIRWCEPLLASPSSARASAAEEAVKTAVWNLGSDPDPRVRFQLALSLGASPDPHSGQVLAQIARHDLADPWQRAAVLSSATRHAGALFAAVAAAPESTSGRDEMLTQLIATAAANPEGRDFETLVGVVLPQNSSALTGWRLTALAEILVAMEPTSAPASPTQRANPAAATGLHSRLQQVLVHAGQWAMDANRTEAERASAIRLLGRVAGTEAEDLRLLARLAGQSDSAPLRKAALATLARRHDVPVASELLNVWKTTTPTARPDILSLLLSREAWLPSLLAAIQQGAVQGHEIALADRQRLRQHPQAAVRDWANSYFSQSPTTERSAVLRQFQAALLPGGDVARGADLFSHYCATCHAFRGQGFEVGPSLAALRDKDRDYWLKNILDPNAVIEPRYVSYLIDTKDGRSLLGIISAETSTGVTLAQAGGAKETLLRRDISEIRASGLSLMPEGLEQNLSPAQMTDLLAYLKSGPAPFGSGTLASVARARQELLALGNPGVHKVLDASERLNYPSWLGTLPMPHCRQTDGKSKLRWQTPPVPATSAPDATHLFRIPVAMGFASQPAGTFQFALNGRVVLSFEVSREDHNWRSADDLVRLSYTVKEISPEDSNGLLTIEVSGRLLTPGQPAFFEVTGSARGSQRWFGVYQLENP